MFLDTVGIEEQPGLMVRRASTFDVRHGMSDMSSQNGQQKPLKVIPRSEAVFWMDGQGYWCNRHGRIENPRIARHFHACIHKDEQGYFLFQEHPDYLEKVYFSYEYTAVFAVDVKTEPQLRLVLNTGLEATLEPEHLYIRGDSLYTRMGEHRIKFGPRALVKLARFVDFDQDPPLLRLKRGDFPIARQEEGLHGGHDG
jgi:hypothetical protein